MGKLVIGGIAVGEAVMEKLLREVVLWKLPIFIF